MTKASELLSEYIKAETIKHQGPTRYVVQDYEQADLKDAKTDKVDSKWALTLDGSRPKLLLNKENTKTLIEEFGDEMDDWIGKTIEVYHDPSVKFGGQKVGGLRVRVPDTEVS